MQVRVFESENMTSGLQKIRQELGPDALILSTKTIRNGSFGVLGKPILEITAAIDDAPPEKNSPKMALPSATGRGFRHVVNDDLGQLLQPDMPDRTGRPLMPPPPQKFSEKKLRPAEQPADNPSENALEQEVRELRSLISGLSAQLQHVAEHKEQKAPIQSKETITAALQAKALKPSALRRDPLLHDLLHRGIEAETARTIAGFLRDNHSEEELLNEQMLQQRLTETIENLIEVASPQFSQGTSQQKIAFVGPTGVGKTTTLAKVCAHYLATVSHSVALITVDTYRIAAVEQLKIYGEIMQLPVDVVFTPKQLEEALQRHRDKELILIDTAGRSPRDSCNIDELASFLRPELEIDKHLVLSASTREKELFATLEQFHRLGLHRTVFTKLDECFTLGVLLNVQLQNPTPLSWLTNGQRVPEDLLHITPKKVAELIMVDGKASA